MVRFESFRLRVLLVLAFVLLVDSTAAAGEWSRSESSHFIMYSNAGRAALEEFSRRLEDFDRFLRLLHGNGGASKSAKLDIYLLARSDDIDLVWTGQHVRGFYASSGVEKPFLIATHHRVRPGRSGDPEADDNIFHEYTHHFMLGNFPAAYPGWVIEGYAQYFQTIDFSSDSVVVGESSTLLRQRMASAWLPWPVVIGSRTSQIKKEQWSAFYGQAWLLAHYMMSDQSRAIAFNSYLRQVAEGQDPLAALLKSLNVDEDTLERNLASYARAPMTITRYPWHENRAGSQISIVDMPASADALLLRDVRGQFWVAEGERKAYIDQMRNLAAQWPGDAFASLALAGAETRYGDPARVPQILSVLEEAPQALQISARSYIVRADREQRPEEKAALEAKARDLADRAYRLAPDDFRTLYTYVLSRKGEPDYPQASTLDALIRAHECYPQSPVVRLDLAASLILRKQFEDASNLLLPLANNPHGGADSLKASELLVQISLMQVAD